jgi:hypothetical protein
VAGRFRELKSSVRRIVRWTSTRGSDLFEGFRILKRADLAGFAGLAFRNRAAAA